jgi:two-component system response regulator MprA
MSADYVDILIVEDDEAFSIIIAKNLAARGYRARLAGTANTALAEIGASKPGLMLLDINLPDRSGWDILRDLRTRGEEVPTIVLSAVRVTQSRLDDFRPKAYLPKPFPLEALIRLIEGKSGEDVSAEQPVQPGEAEIFGESG